jgi:hypothetical protein
MSANNADSPQNVCEIKDGKITANNLTIKGDHNIIHGNNNIVIGNYNELYGNGNSILGDFNKYEGDNVSERGNGNVHFTKTGNGSQFTFHNKIVMKGNTVSHFGPVHSEDGKVKFNCGPVDTRKKNNTGNWLEAKGGHVLGPIHTESVSPSGSKTSISINNLVVSGNATVTMTDDYGKPMVYKANKE